MPSNKILEEKKALVAKLSEELSESCAGVLVSYKGINVEDDTKLRYDLRQAGVKYAVVKNTLLSRAAEKIGMKGLDPILKGTTALAISKDDYTSPAKILCDFAKGHDFFKIKAGFVENAVVNESGVKELANLPSKEMLVAKVLGGLNAPITGFVSVLNGTMRGLVVTLNAIAEQKNQSA